MLEGVSQLQELISVHKHSINCVWFWYIRLCVVRGMSDHNCCVSPRAVIRETKILKLM